MNYSFAAATAIISYEDAGKEEVYLPALVHQQGGVTSYWTLNGDYRSSEEEAISVARGILHEAMERAVATLKRGGFQCHSVEGRQ